MPEARGPAVPRDGECAGRDRHQGIFRLRAALERSQFRDDPPGRTIPMLQPTNCERDHARFGPQQANVLKLCDEMSEAMLIYPWEASWMFRLTSHASTDHGWSAAVIRGQMADTPSWNSTRRAMFMKTDDRDDHPDCSKTCSFAAKSRPIISRRGWKYHGNWEAPASLPRPRRTSTSSSRRAQFALHIRESLVTHSP